MASLVCRAVFSATRRGISTTAVRAADRGKLDYIRIGSNIQKIGITNADEM